MSESKRKDAYAQAGVDIDAGNLFAKMIKERVQMVWPEAGQEIGGFAAGGSIPTGANRVEGSTDGTGTKAILAALTNNFSGIGQDAVAMGAVDAYVSGARPTYLLDSLDVAKLDPDLHIKIIESVIAGCIQSECVLIGGETAELPDMYKYPWMINLNVAVIAFPDPSLSFAPVKPGQKIFGWLSGCVGSNGFSLVRKVFKLKDSPSKIKKRLERKWPELGGASLAEVLLEPTPIWIKEIEKERRKGVKFAGHAHITGGGLIDNPVRILPDNCKVIIGRNAWQRPPIFGLTQRLGKVDTKEMDRTFNNGIIVISIIDSDGPDLENENAILIGEVAERVLDNPPVILTGKYQD